MLKAIAKAGLQGREKDKSQVVGHRQLHAPGIQHEPEQIAQELALHGSDVQQMTTQLRDGIVKKSPQ
jgi:hypothetical protein